MQGGRRGKRRENTFPSSQHHKSQSTATLKETCGVPRFTDEEMDAQGGSGACLGLLSLSDSKSLSPYS